MIAENPAALKIYDKYEQQIHPFDKRAFLPYKPIELLTESGFLSDSFTPAMRVRLDNQTYFLILNDQGELVNRDQAGSITYYSKCTIESGRVKVLVDGTLFLADTPTFRADAGGQRSSLRDGDVLELYYRRGDFIYVFKTGTKPEYGWTYLAPKRKGRYWEPVSKDALSATITDDMTRRIQEELDEINLVLRELFARIGVANPITEKSPRWELNINEKSLECRFLGAPVSAFAESSSLLRSKLQNHVLNTGLTVTQQDSIISIQQVNLR